MNNFALSGIVKMFAPKVEQLLSTGKIDNFIQIYKKKILNGRKLKDGESCEIMLSTESDGKEYISIVIINDVLCITEVLQQKQLSEFISNILKNV